MLHQDLLDFLRIHVVAAGHHHVLLAVDDVEITVGVHAPEIAGVEPAVAESFRVGIGAVEVAFHHRIAPAHQDLFAFDPDLDAG